MKINPRRFWENLNVFVPPFAYGYLVLVAEYAGVVGKDAGDFGASADSQGRSIVLGVLLLLAFTVGLTPSSIHPARVARYRRGHQLLALINGAAFCTALLPLLLANLTGIEAIGHLMWIGLPVLVIAFWIWPIGLIMVWSAWGRRAAALAAGQTKSATVPEEAPSMSPSQRTPPDTSDSAWRVGHQGRDCMYYEEEVNGRWERLEISGEMLMGEAHHVIYFDSAAAWAKYPEWARLRRDDIIARIKSAFRAPDYEYNQH